MTSPHVTELTAPAEESGPNGAVPGIGPLPLHEAMGLVATFGLPTTGGALARSAGEAAELALAIDGPVVMKLVADGLTHKRRGGGVRIGVAREDAAAVFREMIGGSPGAVHGIWVERQVAARLELAFGAFADVALGQVAMATVGGPLIEILGRPAFALAPLTGEDCRHLLEMSGAGAAIKEIFGATSGRSVSVTDDAVALLLAVAGPGGIVDRLGPRELDLNPVMLTDEGPVIADARIVPASPGAAAQTAFAGPATASEERSRRIRKGLDAAFAPRSVAFIGASRDARKAGFGMLRNLRDSRFKGAVHVVHLSGEQILGYHTVENIEDIPPGTDLAVLAVATAVVPQTLERCARRGVKAATVYSAVPPDVRSIPADSSVTVIGPNCLGIHSPAAGISFLPSSDYSSRPGNIAFISQSGLFTSDVIRRGGAIGLRFSTVVSCGNCEDVRPSDYLRYFLDDPRTEQIGMYLESPADARQLLELAKAARKPVILLRGGRTSAGIDIAASHTGALASRAELWDSVLTRQGVLDVRTMDELIDTFVAVKAVLRMPPAPPGHGRRVALVGTGGGESVVAADFMSDAGLIAPTLSTVTQQALASYADPGVRLDNPVDIGVRTLLRRENGAVLEDILRNVAADPAIDQIICYLDIASLVGRQAGRAGVESASAIVDAIDRVGRDGVTVWTVLRPSGISKIDTLVRRWRRRLIEKDIPAFTSTPTAVECLARTYVRAGGRPA